MSAAGPDTVDGTVVKKAEVVEKAKEENGKKPEVVEKAKEENGKKPESGEPGERATG
jgi:hypothetical protein